MLALHLPSEELSPSVILDSEKNIFRIEGRSVMDHPAVFYKSIKDWVEQYAKKPNPTTVLEIKFDYYNTATARELLDIFTTLEKIAHAKVVWHFLEDDEDMEESGQELSHLVKLPFDFRPY